MCVAGWRHPSPLLSACFDESFPERARFPVANERHFGADGAPRFAREFPIPLFKNRFSLLARPLLLRRCVQFRAQPHQSVSTPFTK